MEIGVGINVFLNRENNRYCDFDENDSLEKDNCKIIDLGLC